MTIANFIESIEANYSNLSAINTKTRIIINIQLDDKTKLSIAIDKKRRTDLSEEAILHGHSPYVSWSYVRPSPYQMAQFFDISLCIEQPNADLLTKQIENKNYLEAFDIIMSVMRTKLTLHFIQ